MSSIIYAIAAAVSLALLVGYLVFVRKKDIWFLFLFISVLLVNAGYFSISVSRILEEALLANRISYLGSVFLPLCMFMSVSDVCTIRVPKWITAALMCIGVAVFLLAASPGYSDIYYKEVTLEVIDGTARLVKQYGRFHVVYLIYLISYFGAMIAQVGFAIVRKKITSHKYASMLVAVVFLNILIWLLEQLVPTGFEVLSVSYIASEVILLFLYSIMQDFNEMKLTDAADESSSSPSENDITENPSEKLSEQIPFILEQWNHPEPLTVRELEVLPLILDNCRRKEIAEKLCLSENTVKTHTSHIFTKLSVEGRTELIEKANEILKSR